ncbi:hypothetical protein HPB47_006837, partial [Ixodes persulcatus]
GPQRGGQAPVPGLRDVPQEQSFDRAMLKRGQQQQQGPPEAFPALRHPQRPPQRVSQATPAQHTPARCAGGAAQVAPPAHRPAQPPPQAAGGDRFDMQMFLEFLLVVPRKQTPFPQWPGEGTLGRPISVVIQALDISMRHGPCMQWTRVRRSIFMSPSPRDQNSTGGGQEWKPMLNVDRSATSFYEEQTLLEFMVKVFSDWRTKFSLETTSSLNGSQINTLNEELKLLKVEAMHLPYPCKYRVIRITGESAANLHFFLEDNAKISVAEYFCRRYPRFAHYPQLPCIMVGSATRPVYIPLEACKIPKGQPYRRKLAPDMTKEMIKMTAQPPALRFTKIKAAVQDLKGRVLKAPSIVMKGDQKLHSREGSWDLRDVQFHQAASVESWVLLGMNTPRLRRDELDNFIRLFQQTVGKLGMSVSNPLDIRMKDVGRISTSQILGDIKKDCPSVQLVIVVLGRDSSYADIKRTAETSLGIRTQCTL